MMLLYSVITLVYSLFWVFGEYIFTGIYTVEG